tara:strand:- start:392 stop:844 length:453 start_codon:yes stop_codon:yes gene_type:complete
LKEFFRAVTGITAIVIFFFVVYSTLNYAQSSHHEWKAGDMVWVNHLCANSEILKMSANLMQEGTDKSVKQAEDLWKLAVTSGVCVTSPENFLIRLDTMLEHFPNLFGAEGYHGELWFATTVLPDGTPLRVYSGVIAKEFAAKPTSSSNNI